LSLKINLVSFLPQDLLRWLEKIWFIYTSVTVSV